MLICALVEVFDSTMWRNVIDAVKHSDELKELASFQYSAQVLWGDGGGADFKMERLGIT